MLARTSALDESRQDGFAERPSAFILVAVVTAVESIQGPVALPCQELVRHHRAGERPPAFILREAADGWLMYPLLWP